MSINFFFSVVIFFFTMAHKNLSPFSALLPPFSWCWRRFRLSDDGIIIRWPSFQFWLALNLINRCARLLINRITTVQDWFTTTACGTHWSSSITDGARSVWRANVSTSTGRERHTASDPCRWSPNWRWRRSSAATTSGGDCSPAGGPPERRLSSHPKRRFIWAASRSAYRGSPAKATSPGRFQIHYHINVIKDSYVFVSSKTGLVSIWNSSKFQTSELNVFQCCQ